MLFCPLLLAQQASTAYTTTGLVQSKTDARNTVTASTYDANGNPATAKTGAHPQIATQYDAIGRLTNLTDQASAVTSFSLVGWAHAARHDQKHRSFGV